MPSRILTQFVNTLVIGTALYGEILLCDDTVRDKKVVLKKLDLKYVRAQYGIHCGQSLSEDAMMEIQVYETCERYGGHPCVAKMYEHFVEDEYLCIVLEYYGCGDLYDKVQNEVLSDSSILGYFRQIVQAVVYMHEMGYAHRDVSLENVLVKNADECVLSDFGLAVPIGTDCFDAVGKMFYMAPEVFAGVDGYDAELADAWSLGALLFIMCTKQPLFEVPSDMNQRYKFFVQHGFREFISACQVEAVDPMFVALMEKLLCIHPLDRLEPTQLLDLLPLRP